MSPQPGDNSVEKHPAWLDAAYGGSLRAERWRELRVAAEAERERHPYTADELEQERLRRRS